MDPTLLSNLLAAVLFAVLGIVTTMGRLDASPEELSTSLVNRYLDIHRRELVG